MRISAVIPCFNGEQYLSEALASVRVQTRAADEVIVVDDGSTDRSADIATSMGATVVRQENRGEGAARNAGIAAARGDVIAWLDADDTWRPRHLAVVAGLLESHPEASGAFGGVQRFGDDGRAIFGYVPTDGPGEVLFEAFRDWLHTTIAAVVRRAALIEVGGFDEAQRYSVDFDLWLRLSRSHTFVATREITSNWRWHEGQQSSSWDRQLAAAYHYRRKFIDQLWAEGDGDLASRLEEEIAAVWLRDMRSAIGQKDPRAAFVLRRAARLVETLTPWQRRSWTLLSFAPGPVTDVAMKARRYVRGSAAAAGNRG